MDHQEETLFKSLAAPSAPPDLGSKILARIQQIKGRQARQELGVWSALAASSLLALVPILNFLAQSLSQSGLIQYLSLTWSDANFLVSHWPLLAWSILDSVPVLLVASLTLLLILLTWSMTKLSTEFNFKTLTA